MSSELICLVNTINAAIEAFDRSTDINEKIAQLPIIERTLIEILLLSPDHEQAKLLTAMLPSKKAELYRAMQGENDDPENKVQGIVVGMFARDDKTAALHREATALKKAGDCSGAVARLQLAKLRMIVSPVYYPIESWCRYPVFLQQAGNFDEAMRELEWLIENLPCGRSEMFAHRGSYSRRMMVAHELSVIYDKMRLVCKREKRLDESSRYTGLRDEQRDLWCELKPKADDEFMAEIESSARRRAARDADLIRELRTRAKNP